MDQRLKDGAQGLSQLVLILPAEHLGDLLDITAGALASLIRAEQLEYTDTDRLGKELPAKYYLKLAERIAKMTAGTLPPHGRWISGYYFNSALLRLGAAREITYRLLTKLDKKKKTPGPNLKPINLDAVYKEYCSLKHNLRSLRLGRNVSFQQAVQALVELVEILDKRKGELSDSNTKFPIWKRRGK